MDVSGVQWRRLLVEGVVIVVSILLAFAIDAWWDERQEEAAARQEVARVVSELQANIKILEAQIGRMEVTTGMARELMAMIKPEPEPFPREELPRVFDALFSSDTVSLPNSATNDFLSSGQLVDEPWATIRHELSQVISTSRIAERRSLELRAMRRPLNDLVGQHLPTRDTTLSHPVMAAYTPSEFPYDPTTLLSDMAFENQVAEFAIRMELNLDLYKTLLEHYEQVLARIEDARAE